MRYLPNEACREAEQAILSAQAHASHHHAVALDAMSSRDVAKQQASETEWMAALKAENDEDTRMLQAAEYEKRITVLERTLEAERAAHAAGLQDLQRQLKEMQTDADARVEYERRLRAEAVAAADARAREAERAADEARTRAEEKVASARASAEARVKEVRATCDERVRTHEAQRRLEAERLKAEVTADRRALDEKNRMCLEQRHVALCEAKRRIESSEKGVQMWMSSKECQLVKKEADWSDWGETQKQQKKGFEAHHKQLLEMEQNLHKRTMERTLDRVVRHMKFGDTDLNNTSSAKDMPT